MQMPRPESDETAIRRANERATLIAANLRQALAALTQNATFPADVELARIAIRASLAMAESR